MKHLDPASTATVSVEAIPVRLGFLSANWLTSLLALWNDSRIISLMLFFASRVEQDSNELTKLLQNEPIEHMLATSPAGPPPTPSAMARRAVSGLL
jgi:hypothetical protein